MYKISSNKYFSMSHLVELAFWIYFFHSDMHAYCEAFDVVLHMYASSPEKIWLTEQKEIIAKFAPQSRQRVSKKISRFLSFSSTYVIHMSHFHRYRRNVWNIVLTFYTCKCLLLRRYSATASTNARRHVCVCDWIRISYTVKHLQFMSISWVECVRSWTFDSNDMKRLQ